MSFQEYRIDSRCLRVLKKQQIFEPTPVQAEAIPPALEGRDVVAVAQTGTGKTLAFALPALTRLADTQETGTSMLVVTPTRELALQVQTVLHSMGKPLGLRVVSVYGGVSMEPQTKALRRGVDIVVACPGRLLDHMERGNARLDRVSILVLDEADRMLDMGFLPDIKRILKALPKDRQTMLFSATFPKEIERLASRFQREPVRVEVGRVATPVDSVRQGVYTVDPKAKMSLLTKLLKEKDVDSALVFIRTKHRTDRVAKGLRREGLKALAIHGGRTQNQRQRALDGFRRGHCRILVATDVASRGLDIQGITHVVNYDIPASSDDYIHRIGRTARANAEGDAITFVCPEDHQALGSIEAALGKRIPREDWEGAVHVRSQQDRSRGGRRDRGWKSPHNRGGQSSRGPKGRRKRPRRGRFASS